MSTDKCRGRVLRNMKLVICLAPGQFKHMALDGFEWWLCKKCEGRAMKMLDEDRGRALNSFIHNGKELTGVHN